MMKKFCICILCLLSGAALFGQKVHIHSIEELNRNYGTDTHLKENRYKLEADYRTIVELGEAQLGHRNLHYPRVKKLADGSYILFYQRSRIGRHCYCAFSADGMNWTGGGRVFEARDIVNSGGEEDTRAYSTVDAVVLDNGDILAFASYRAVKGYKRFPQDDGLCMKRSSDGEGPGVRRKSFTPASPGSPMQCNCLPARCRCTLPIQTMTGRPHRRGLQCSVPWTGEGPGPPTAR